jgi:hypothetical protein
MHKIWRTIRNFGIRSARLRLCVGLGLAVLLALLCGLAGHSQSFGSNGGQGQDQSQSQDQGQASIQPHYAQPGTSSQLLDSVDPVIAERRMRALNEQRQKQMVSDADKLLKLARDLNEELAAQNTGTFTPDELHKIAEIEKLARNVRQKMAEGASDPQPTLQPPPMPNIPIPTVR